MYNTLEDGERERERIDGSSIVIGMRRGEDGKCGKEPRSRVTGVSERVCGLCRW